MRRRQAVPYTPTLPFWSAWTQNPQRAGRTFTSEAEARVWAEANAPFTPDPSTSGSGFAFVQGFAPCNKAGPNRGVLQIYRADTRTWSEGPVAPAGAT